MKNLIFLFLLVTSRILGQSHQEQILKFVDENKGKKVGGGLCYELVQSAIRTYNVDYDGSSYEKNKYGKEVKLKDIQPGDICRMTGGTKRKVSHVCIVYKVVGDKIYVAEQNTNGSLKDSVVEVNPMNYEWHEEYYGKIKYNFYRQ